MTKLKLKEGVSRTGDITLYGHVQINLLTLCAPMVLLQICIVRLLGFAALSSLMHSPCDDATGYLAITPGVNCTGNLPGAVMAYM